MNHPLERPLSKTLSLTLVVLLCLTALRIASLGLTGLIDATEGRYAAVAQEMYITGNWVTPMVPLEEGFVPYWGKPPLHFWNTAITYAVFGMSEWSSRFPGFVAALVTCLFTAVFARTFFKPGTASLAAIILGTSALFFFLSGGTALDMTLTAGISGGIVSFILCTREGATNRRLWGAGFFLSLAAATLTKGPIGIVLVGVPLTLWLLITRRWGALARVPWLWGIPLYLLVTVPWFLIAERATPGFLHYFFINENFQRYLIPNYQDRYGSGHRRPYGTAWVLLFLGFLPWAGLFPSLIGRYRTCRARLAPELFFPVVLTLAWGLAPALFFTFARQLTGTYVLPAMPGLAIITAAAIIHGEEWGIADRCGKFVRAMVWFAVLVGLVVAGLGVWSGAPWVATAQSLALVVGAVFVYRVTAAQRGDVYSHAALAGLFAGVALLCAVISGSHVVTERKSTQYVLEAIKAVSPNGTEVGFFFGFPYSAFFYDDAETNHSVKMVRLSPEVVSTSTVQNFIVRRKDLKRLPPATLEVAPIKETIGEWTWLSRVAPPPALNGRPNYG